jgi:hypothetical protein
MRLELDITDELLAALQTLASDDHRSVEDYTRLVLHRHCFGQGFVSRPYTEEELARFQARKSRTRDLLTAKQRNSIFERDEGKCAYCKGIILYDEPWHIDHIQPVANGGTNDPENLTLSCVACNLKKGKRDAQNFTS